MTKPKTSPEEALSLLEVPTVHASGDGPTVSASTSDPIVAPEEDPEAPRPPEAPVRAPSASPGETARRAGVAEGGPQANGSRARVGSLTAEPLEAPRKPDRSASSSTSVRLRVERLPPEGAGAAHRAQPTGPALDPARAARRDLVSLPAFARGCLAGLFVAAALEMGVGLDVGLAGLATRLANALQTPHADPPVVRYEGPGSGGRDRPPAEVAERGAAPASGGTVDGPASAPRQALMSLRARLRARQDEPCFGPAMAGVIMRLGDALIEARPPPDYAAALETARARVREAETACGLRAEDPTSP